MLLFSLRIFNQLLRGWLRPVAISKTSTSPISYDVTLRCWPIDMDMFMHMNNAMYLRCAELARWRVFPQSDSLRMTSMSGILFLAVEQHVVYQRPIMPFSQYVVRTTINAADNKWLLYKHTFQQHPSQVKAGEDPKIYAVVDCKAVLKEKTGKTVKIDQIAKSSEFYGKLLSAPEGDAHHHRTHKHTHHSSH